MTGALGVEATAGALERYRRRAGRLIVVGVVTLALAAAVGITGIIGVSGPVSWVLALGIVSVGGGIGSLVLARRMRRALGAGVWSAHPAVAVGQSRYATSVVLRSPDGGEAWPLTVITTRQRYELLRPGPDGVLWWCGDPRRGGVLAPPGGGELIWAKPLRGARVRRRIVARAESEGLMLRAAPRQPQEPAPVPVTGPVAVAADVPVTGPVAVDVPDAVDVPVTVHGRSVRLDQARPASGPTYAVLAAHARRQAMPPGKALRPEADVRKVAWWRVRSLRRAAGTTRVLVALAFCAAVGAVALTGPPEEGAVKLYAIGLLVLGALVYSCYGLLVTGRPAARLMARAATSSPPTPRRYVLLYDPQGGGPVLVLFPVHGGLYVQPEGLLPLIPPGPPKEPRRGLPPRPVGTAWLHGWRDFTPDGRMPFVVPWIEGRPLWPAGPYWATDGRPEFTALLDRLAPPLETRAP
ncbi:hypothetical protein [Streptomyces sp. TLI_105]|uniref:hypothetical protein n=1 Tax=Streptomyces sp. TLI_105 TaxID=1881019 RepID=UPI00089998E2|nr:hypothetical protein [Streptomyces sp. TLI_105]SED06412.1 hypothetical protein SAMN05428939_4095 [Streptomyces sp. TLI_105]